MHDSRAFIAAVVAAVQLVFPAVVAANDDDSVYESIDDVAIGRVFLSPGQRARLDELRLLAPDARGPSTPVDAQSQSTAPRAGRAKAAGYIQSSGGQRREWSGDDFVVASESTDDPVVFPGDVDITRHSGTDGAAETADVDKGK